MVSRRCFPLVAASPLFAAAKKKRMHFGDAEHLGRPFAKDPSAVYFGGRYLMYYSLATKLDAKDQPTLFAIGIAASTNLIDWKKVGEMLPGAAYEAKGLCAPCAKVIDGKVHLFYQTYGNGRNDAICHAVSNDGLSFTRNATNPIFHPTGNWNAGRAIDADVIDFKDRWLLYAASRDPQMKTQLVVGAWAPKSGNFDRKNWTMLSDAPLLKPELPWEGECIEAPSVIKRGDDLYMFYAGAYNNAPQVIGCAHSTDGVRWQRLFVDKPLLANGRPGSWNSSESGHPGAFIGHDGQTYMLYQGNNDNGRTWFLSIEKIAWRKGLPHVVRL